MQRMQTVAGPVAARERIAALDVVRGFALLGIALMNVEFFNRPLASLGDGLPGGLSGTDSWVGLLIHLSVRTKFFTMFSILFGMGFALMLARAQAAGRPFLGTYLRRTIALALFGIVHGTLIWAGDILLSYAAGAALLLVVLFGRGWLLWLVFALVIALAFGVNPGGDAAFTAVILLVDALVLALLRRGAVSGQLLHGRRLLRAGLVLYLLPALLMAIAGGLMWMGEARQPSDIGDQTAPAARARAAQDAQIARMRAEMEQRKLRETRVMSSGTYAEAVALRGPEFFGDFAKSLFFVSVAAGLFMIGAWLMQSGAMHDPTGHLPLFHRLVWLAMPIGVAATAASAFVATNAEAGQGRWLLAMGLLFAGGMPVSLGYIGLLMLALQRAAGRRMLEWMAPAGRMALTNYIGQSVLGSLYFYGYGLGHWGMPRSQQVLYVLVVFVLQVLFSHWWLSKFRFGPLEWLWRWMTYGTRPPLRIDAAA